MDIESKRHYTNETPLLSMARKFQIVPPTVLRALLYCGVDVSAVDYKGRGLLHLALMRNRRRQLSFEWLKRKIVLLLRAGCSIYAVDDFGRTPTDLARETCVSIIWKRALGEVGMLDEETKRLILDMVCRAIHHALREASEFCI